MDGASVFSPRPRARRPRATSPRAIVRDLIRRRRGAARTMTPRSTSQKGGARVVAVRLVVGSRARASVRGDRPIDRMSDHVIHTPQRFAPYSITEECARGGQRAPWKIHSPRLFAPIRERSNHTHAVAAALARRARARRRGRGLDVVALCGRDATGETSWLVREARAMIESIGRSVDRSIGRSPHFTGVASARETTTTTTTTDRSMMDVSMSRCLDVSSLPRLTNDDAR